MKKTAIYRKTRLTRDQDIVLWASDRFAFGSITPSSPGDYSTVRDAGVSLSCHRPVAASPYKILSLSTGSLLFLLGAHSHSRLPRYDASVVAELSLLNPDLYFPA
ncbi:hypothetical protein OUZ56_000284 [Daphnia magna]|uniref:Uncharacterized protein n=1 Tax=Daphnia magna TaxID=35525 RepID=A0ABQ9ZZ72_9CRUS|nr:hypothetical protein OUZ56_000284 [Daphnia magna]